LLENPLYYVLLEGRRVGPYDRRTILGMRVKKTLTGANVVIADDGREFTVRELVRMGAPQPGPQPERGLRHALGGSRPVLQATHSAWLVEVAGRGIAIPAFKGEIELRVHTRVLRIAGRFREALGWKEGRVKIALQDVLHARVRGSVVELGLRSGGVPMQRLVLELFTPEDAAGFVEALPQLAPWPEDGQAVPAPPRRHAPRGPYAMAWMAVVGTVVAVGGVLAWVFTR
jgi:hypothetical protein